MTQARQHFVQPTTRLYNSTMRRDRNNNSNAWLAGTLAALLACFSQQAAIALEDDADQPIHITTDEALRDEKTGRTVYEGNVELVQGTIRIFADRITFYHLEDEAERIVAEGTPARYQQQPEPDAPLMHAHGDTIEYFRDEDRVQLRENAQVEQDGQLVTGDQIDYFIREQLVKAASEPSDTNSRVKVIIPPHKLDEEE